MTDGKDVSPHIAKTHLYHLSIKFKAQPKPSCCIYLQGFNSRCAAGKAFLDKGLECQDKGTFRLDMKKKFFYNERW